MKIRKSLAFFGLLGVSAMLTAGVGVWTTNGPHGGRVLDLVISPLSPNNLYLATGRGGVFRTTNGGGTWSRAEAGLPDDLLVRGLDAATSGTSVAYVFTSGTGIAYRTADFGLSWFPLPSPWSGIEFPFDLDVGPGNGSRVALTTGTAVYSSNNDGSSWTTSAVGSFALGDIGSVAIAANGDIYAAAQQYDALGYDLEMIRKSTDGGATWVAAGPTPDLDPGPGVQPLFFSIQDVVTAPNDANRVYAAGGAIATSADAGMNWAEVQTPNFCSVSAISVSPTAGESIWAQCNSGTLFRTDDATVANPVWVEMEVVANNYTVNGIDPAQSAAIALHPNYPAVPHVVAGTEYGGILRSTNNGTLWLQQNNGFESTTIRALATHPLDSEVVLAGFGDSFTTTIPVYSSSDSGASWAPSINGLSGDQVRAITIDPTTVDANPLTTEDFHVYAVGRGSLVPDVSSLDGGVYKSTDSGNNWVTIDNGIGTIDFGGPMPQPFMGTVRSVVLDPRSCDTPPATGPCPAVVPPTAASTLKTVLVGGSGRLTSSAPGTACVDTLAASRIYRSTDSGANWVASDTGIPLSEDLDPGTPGQQCVQIGGVVPLVIDPNNPQVLYAGTFMSRFDPSFPTDPTLNNGVFKSIDGGLTWTHSSTGLP
ncbi:MAG: hypothetical protein AAGJ52_14035, partial [Pseudomonadota bacterium]